MRQPKAVRFARMQMPKSSLCKAAINQEVIDAAINQEVIDAN
jgi:hypothetical protein